EPMEFSPLRLAHLIRAQTRPRPRLREACAPARGLQRRPDTVCRWRVSVAARSDPTAGPGARRPAGVPHGLGAGQPFLRMLGDFIKQSLEFGTRRLEDMVLGEPAQDLAAGHAHALSWRGDEALVEIADQHFFDHVPGIVRTKEPLDVVRIKDL